MDQASPSLPSTPSTPPPRRNFGMLWVAIILGSLALLLMWEPRRDGLEEDDWRQYQRNFQDTYALEPGVILRPSGLMIRHLEEGAGASPNSESMVTVHYEGRLVDGRLFDSSRDRGEPATFPLAGVIPGWREALPMMREGGRAEVVIPADLAYGDRSMARGLIPANSTLLFEVELISVE